MPLYAYRCTKCGHRFEKRQNFSAAPEVACPLCQGLLERPLTAPRLQFKGAGWYVNDYAAKSSAPSSETASTESKTSDSSDSKAPAKVSETSSSAASTPAAAPASTPASSSSSGESH